MKCPNCGNDIVFEKKQVGVDDMDNPIINQYAICYNCRKQWNLDKKKVKKPDQVTKTVPNLQAVGTNSSDTETIPLNANGAMTEFAENRNPGGEGRQRYSNIPPEEVRASKERSVKQAYDEMVAAETDSNPAKSRRSRNDVSASRSTGNRNSDSRGNQGKKRKKPETRMDIPDEVENGPGTLPRVLRILVGLLTLIGFVFYAYRGLSKGLSGLTSGMGSGRLPSLVLAICMLAAGLLLVTLSNKGIGGGTIFPMFFLLGGAAFTFIWRNDSRALFYGMILSIILAVICLVLAVLSATGDGGQRGQHRENYDDFYEDDYDFDQN